MKRSVYSAPIDGTITAPASKSMAQRAIALCSVASTPCTVRGVTPNKDVDAALQAAGALGTDIAENDGDYLITPGGASTHHLVNCLEAGLSVRMFSPIAALQKEEFSFTGAPALMKRPITMIEEALRQLGVYCSTNKGYLPMTIQGPMEGGRVRIDGAISSQLLTGLLIALPVTSRDSLIEVVNLKSRPYIDMTLDIIADFGGEISHEDYSRFQIKGGQQYSRDDYVVEGDWSGAAFMLVAGALGGSVTVTNLREGSPQADREIMRVLKICGAVIDQGPTQVTVKKGELTPFDFDATHCPDLFPPLVALASGISGRSIIRGTHRLIHKESNRRDTLIEEFSAIGVDISADGDTLVVEGGSVTGGKVHSHNDHRIAMACACGALVSREGIEIDDSGAVEKSYPRFFEDLRTLGGRVE